MSTMSYASIWNETLQKIQESNYFDSHTFNSWISKTTLFKIEDNIAYVAYRSTITFSILKKQKEKELFESTLSEVGRYINNSVYPPKRNGKDDA